MLSIGVTIKSYIKNLRRKDIILKEIINLASVFRKVLK
jgi:hypothetical protein